MSSRPRTVSCLLSNGFGRIAGPAVGFLLLALFVPRALAVINPRFTPRDLVKGTAEIRLLRVSEPQGKAMA
ncbi:MAG: hypothetical protein ABR915_24825, partial [Thermoguttaceae bacterium]